MSYKTCPDWPELMELAPDLQFKHISRCGCAAAVRRALEDLARLARRDRDVRRPRAPRLQRRATPIPQVVAALAGTHWFEVHEWATTGPGASHSSTPPERRADARSAARRLSAWQRSSSPSARAGRAGSRPTFASTSRSRCSATCSRRPRAAARCGSSPTMPRGRARAGLGVEVVADPGGGPGGGGRRRRWPGSTGTASSSTPTSRARRRRRSAASRRSRPRSSRRADGTTNALALPDAAPGSRRSTAPAAPPASRRSGRRARLDPRARARRRHARRPRATPRLERSPCRSAGERTCVESTQVLAAPPRERRSPLGRRRRRASSRPGCTTCSGRAS